MKYRIEGNRLFLNYDETTKMEFDLEGLEDKIESIPVDYMSSIERNDLLKFLKDKDLI